MGIILRIQGSFKVTSFWALDEKLDSPFDSAFRDFFVEVIFPGSFHEVSPLVGLEY